MVCDDCSKKQESIKFVEQLNLEVEYKMKKEKNKMKNEPTKTSLLEWMMIARNNAETIDLKRGKHRYAEISSIGSIISTNISIEDIESSDWIRQTKGAK